MFAARSVLELPQALSSDPRHFGLAPAQDAANGSPEETSGEPWPKP